MLAAETGPMLSSIGRELSVLFVFCFFARRRAVDPPTPKHSALQSRMDFDIMILQVLRYCGLAVSASGVCRKQV